MMPNWISFSFRPGILGVCIASTLGMAVVGHYAGANDVQFNTYFLDIKDRENIDLGQFTRSGYIMPGNYMMLVRINKRELPEQSVVFYPEDGDGNGSSVCLSPQLVDQFGLKPEVEGKLTWWHQDECLVLESLPGVSAEADLGSSSLRISVPQAYLEYVAEHWDPPSSWDHGIAGLLLDYNLNARALRQQQNSRKESELSGNGVVGANLGAWRLRADWQGRVKRQSGSEVGKDSKWDFSRYYAYRALPRLGAKLTLGEDYLRSNIFDSFRFTGASLGSDDNMLPPNLRGYAPEVTGVARTNAKVVVSQQGRILYETQVASGPFRIQDINDAVTGQLDVRIEELDGSVQEFHVDTANIPYLTRPGTIRYKVASGRPSNWQHKMAGSLFATGEFSWGVNNGWSLYGGGIAEGDYTALALGVGRDLMVLGALSFDVTQSRARLAQWEEGTLTGGSYRLSYSKNFDQYDSQVTFAGYRFSDRNYMSMNEYLEARSYGVLHQNSKEMYTVSLNKNFRDFGMSIYLNYDHQTYWNSQSNDRYTMTVSRNFDIGRLRNVSLSLTGYRNKYNGSSDDGMYLSLSVPWGGNTSVSYSGNYDRRDSNHQVMYHSRLENGDSYQLGSGLSNSGETARANYNHVGNLARVNANVNYQSGGYSSVGLSLQGGATATLQGAALHRIGVNGGTRMLVDTDNVANIPIGNYGAMTWTNRFGKAVVTDVSSYYRNRVSINVNKLPENAEAISSVVQATLTEGAIGYRRFEVIAGEKAMAQIRLANGSTPPFGAQVQNSKKKNIGIVNDDGSVYLSGINPAEEIFVLWDNRTQCVLTLPEKIPNSGETELLLPCRELPAITEKESSTG